MPVCATWPKKSRERTTYKPGRVKCEPAHSARRGACFSAILTEAFPLDPMNQRMQSFVERHGEIPREARRLQDREARNHATPWLRHHLGRGIVSGYVIGYQLGERWWTFFFERTSGAATDGAEQWWVEAYDCNGQSWSGNYYYLLRESRWQPV
jgi:hypothetical protein